MNTQRQRGRVFSLPRYSGGGPGRGFRDRPQSSVATRSASRGQHRSLVAIILASATLLVTGCAAPPTRQEAFADVSQTVSDRTGHRVHWRQGTDEDTKVAEQVTAMLADELTPDEAVQLALLNNRNLQATYEDLGLAQADLVQAGLLKNPVFDAEVRFAEGGGGTGIDMSVVLEFIDVLYIPLRREMAGIALEAAQARVAGAALDLAGRTRLASYDLIAAQQTVELRRTALDAAAASYEISKRLFDAGNVPELDMTTERATYEQSKLDLASAEAHVIQRRERLNRFMGLWGPQAAQWSMAHRLPPVQPDAPAPGNVEQTAIERSLDLAAARNELSRTATRLGIARSTTLIPELELGAAAEREPDGEWAVGPAFSLPIPLFDQGQGRVATAQSELRRARERYAAAAIDIRSAARAALAATTAARDRAEYHRTVLIPLRQSITGQTQRQFNAMQVGPFQLLAAREREVTAGAAYVESLRDYWHTRTQLELILAGRVMETDDAMPAPSSSASSREERSDH